MTITIDSQLANSPWLSMSLSPVFLVLQFQVSKQKFLIFDKADEVCSTYLANKSHKKSHQN